VSPKHLESALASTDAVQMLPYLAGSKYVIAYQYPVKTTAFAVLFVGPTIGSLAAILLVGFAAAFLVPRLPLGIPRRDFRFAIDDFLSPTWTNHPRIVYSPG
jgi:hypothetical protein